MRLTVAKYYIPSGRCIQALDYTKKDDKGKAIKVVDSVGQVFKTKNGRKVYDGEGITPDVIVEKKENPQVLRELYSKQVLFDFATYFRNLNDTLSPPDQFNVDEDLYKSFRDYLEKEDFSYESKEELKLNEVKTLAEKSGKIKMIEKDLNNLESVLELSKEEQFDIHSDEIQHALEEELMLRYYYQEGKIRSSLKYDPDIEEAKTILNNPERYREILQP